MRSLLLASAAVLLGTSFVQAQHHSQHVEVNVPDITFRDGPPSLPKGSQVAVLYGDPAKEGMFVMRLKLPANYRIPPHTHPGDEVVTVISGEFRIGMGRQFDAAVTKPIAAGGVVAMSPGMEHFVETQQETVVQLSTRGPWAINYINPADDPRKSQ